MNETYSILVAGLKASDEDFVLSHFSELGHKVVAAGNLAEARNELKTRKVDLIYLRTSETENPANKLEEIFASDPSLPVVFVCDKAVDGFILNAWRSGASDIIFTPFTTQSLDGSLQRSSQRLLPQKPEKAAQAGAKFFYLDDVSGKECRVDIQAPRFTIGRSSANDMVVGQMGVSRFHAEVLTQNGEYLLRDLGSKMGTYVNGVKSDQARLKDGDRIQLGSPQSPSISFHTGDLLQSLLSRSDSNTDIGMSLYNFNEIGKLFEAFRALSSIPVLDDLLAQVLDTAIDLTGAERGFIMLKEQGEDLSFRCARNNNKQSLEGSCFQTSHRVPRDAYQTGKPVVINDIGFEEGTNIHESTVLLGLRSVCCVPLRYIAVRESGGVSTVAQAETIGVLYVDSSNTLSGISGARINALETLASEAAIAIYNARLLKISQDKRRMDEQLAIAREIQQALLPHPERDLQYLRVCSQSIPCYDIGGDFFDYFDLENGRFGIAIGDVAGKGMPAALLASLVQGVFSAQNLNNIPLPRIISRVNNNLAQRGPGNRFVTFFFAILDPEGNCVYVNAGHNPPILLLGDGTLKELKEGGMVLGLFRDAQYESGTVKLEPGDHLVLFTDGVVEALNPDGEEFGEDRLSGLLRKNARSSAKEILTHIRESVLSFSDCAPQYDDITLMVLGFGESSAQA